MLDLALSPDPEETGPLQIKVKHGPNMPSGCYAFRQDMEQCLGKTFMRVPGIQLFCAALSTNLSHELCAGLATYLNVVKHLLQEARGPPGPPLRKSLKLGYATRNLTWIARSGWNMADLGLSITTHKRPHLIPTNCDGVAVLSF